MISIHFEFGDAIYLPVPKVKTRNSLSHKEFFRIANEKTVLLCFKIKCIVKIITIFLNKLFFMQFSIIQNKSIAVEFYLFSLDFGFVIRMRWKLKIMWNYIRWIIQRRTGWMVRFGLYEGLKGTLAGSIFGGIWEKSKNFDFID